MWTNTYRNMQRRDRYYALGSVCIDCATAAGFVLKHKYIGVWTAKCAVCGKVKPTCDLMHDYHRTLVDPKGVVENGGEK